MNPESPALGRFPPEQGAHAPGFGFLGKTLLLLLLLLIAFGVSTLEFTYEIVEYHRFPLQPLCAILLQIFAIGYHARSQLQKRTRVKRAGASSGFRAHQ